MRRWPRRTLFGLAALVVVAIMLAAATFAYSFWSYHELNRVAVANLVTVRSGSPFNVLIVGTTPVNKSRHANRRSTTSVASVILLARIDPKQHDVRLVDVAPQTEVTMSTAGSSALTTRPVADALEGGPGNLVRTIASDLQVPITDYLALKLSGVGSVVGALGGIHLDFTFPERDAYTGLSIDKTGCQLVSGSQTRALFESRHLYYFANGAWRADLHGTSSVLAREGTVFSATVTSSGGILFDPVELNNLVSSVVANLTIDNALSESRLLSLAEMFRGFSRGELTALTLPTVLATSRSGHEVTAPATRADDALIARFLAFGTSSPPSSLLRNEHIVLPPGLSVRTSEPFADSTVHLAWNPTPC